MARRQGQEDIHAMCRCTSCNEIDLLLGGFDFHRSHQGGPEWRCGDPESQSNYSVAKQSAILMLDSTTEPKARRKTYCTPGIFCSEMIARVFEIWTTEYSLEPIS